MAAPSKVFINNQAPQCDADDLNSYTKEINNAIEAAGLALNDKDKTQLTQSLINISMSGTFFDYSGDGNSIILTTKAGKLAPKKYYDGMRVAFFASSKNTSTVTVNLAGLGVKQVKKLDGSDLIAGDVDGFIELIYQESANQFYLLLHSANMAEVKTSSIVGITKPLPDNLIPVTAAAWVNFNGIGGAVIRDSFNVSSVTYSGTGSYTVNFEDQMLNDDYAVQVTGDGSSDTLTPAIVGYRAESVSSVEIRTRRNTDAVPLNSERVSVVIFGGK